MANLLTQQRSAKPFILLALLSFWKSQRPDGVPRCGLLETR